jgi:hypothetical protein
VGDLCTPTADPDGGRAVGLISVGTLAAGCLKVQEFGLCLRLTGYSVNTSWKAATNSDEASCSHESCDTEYTDDSDDLLAVYLRFKSV